MNRVVVVGASLAAVHLIEALREFGYQREVVLVGAESELPYDRTPLSKELLREPTPELPLLRDSSWYEKLGVQLRLGSTATGLDVQRRSVQLESGDEISYDSLAITTGSQARELATAPTLRSFDDASRIRRGWAGADSVIVVGAGFLGLEVAASARELGMDVDVVELATSPLSRILGDEVGTWFRQHHERHGVRVHVDALIDSVEQHGNSWFVRLIDGTPLAADFLVAAVGADPNVSWLRGSGVRVADGVWCDATLCTSAPDVVAAGDVARWYNPLFDESMRVEQWANAIEQGRLAAGSLLGERQPCAVVPYYWSDQFDARMRFVGNATAAAQVDVVEASQSRLVVKFGRDGLLRGALCVNAPKSLAQLRSAVQQNVSWEDAG